MLKKPWETDSCEQVLSYYSIYPVPVAAALWCNIPANEVQEHLDLAEEVHRAIYRHPYIPCLEPRCRAIHEAIQSGILPVSRENGKSFDGSQEHVAPERRHVNRHDLKVWIGKEFQSDKPSFLFDEIERSSHPAISIDSYHALQADRDALKTRIENAEEWAKKTIREQSDLKKSYELLQSQLNSSSTLNPRSETTYLNIIAGLLQLMLEKSPSGQPYSSFDNQSAIISALLAHYGSKPGISLRTLEDKFAAAKRSLGSN